MPVEVEAIQFTRDKIDQVKEFTENKLKRIAIPIGTILYQIIKDNPKIFKE